jgi:hypothetical protein
MDSVKHFSKGDKPEDGDNEDYQVQSNFGYPEFLLGVEYSKHFSNINKMLSFHIPEPFQMR